MGIDLIAIKLWRGNESVCGFNDHNYSKRGQCLGNQNCKCLLEVSGMTEWKCIRVISRGRWCDRVRHRTVRESFWEK